MDHESINGALCVHCGSVIVSTHDHDFQSCKCEQGQSISVDGGRSYKRRVHGSKASWIELNNLDDLLTAAQLHIEVSNGSASVQS